MKRALTDGRHARAVRTREAILSALLELLDEGDPDPTAGAIAARAQVALRSIAQHFRTREQLLLALAARHAARLPRVEVDVTQPLRRRLKTFVEQRAQVLEETAPIRRVATRAAPSSRPVQRALATVAQQRRAELRQAFAPELRRTPSWVEPVALALASGPGWDELRQQCGTALQARQTLERALERLLTR